MFGWCYRLADRARSRARRRRWEAGRALGREAEDIAHRYLQRGGMTVVARNWRTRSGSAEIDLIARDGDTLVFVEVKARTKEEHGAPDRAIDQEKRRKVGLGAWEYARRAGWDPRMVRFDVVGVVLEPQASVTHWRDAFGMEVPR